jgi:hypothetical protein
MSIVNFIFLIIIVLFILNLIRYEKGYKVVSLLKENQVKYILNKWHQRDYDSIKEYFLNNSDRDVKQQIIKLFGNDYILIDYIYMIENSAIHTYHRDYTSSQNYNNLTKPSYTMILYLDDFDNELNLIPGSHLDSCPIYLFDKSKKISVKPGMAIIFNADILHSGAIIDSNRQRHCIQFKIIHKDDILKLPKLLNYHVLIDKKNDKPILTKKIESNLTKHFPIFMDITQDIIKESFTETKTPLQTFISDFVFSDKDFYKPIRI